MDNIEFVGVMLIGMIQTGRIIKFRYAKLGSNGVDNYKSTQSGIDCLG